MAELVMAITAKAYSTFVGAELGAMQKAITDLNT